MKTIIKSQTAIISGLKRLSQSALICVICGLIILPLTLNAQNIAANGTAQAGGQSGNIADILVPSFAVLLMVGALVFMIRVRIGERKRRFKPLPVGEQMATMTESQVDPECAQMYRIFLEKKETVEMDDVPCVVFRNRQDIDDGYELLVNLKRQAFASGQPNDCTLSLINNWGTGLNNLQRRVTNASIWLFVIVVTVFLPMVLVGSFLRLLVVLLLLVTYYYCLQIPSYKLIRPEPGYYAFFNKLFMRLPVASLFVAAKSAVTAVPRTIYIFHGDSRLYVEEDTVENTIDRYVPGILSAAIIISCLCAFGPIVIFLHGALNFYRNYIDKK